MTRVLEKLEEYRERGIPNIWLIDPRLEKMYIFRSSGLEEVHDVVFTGNPRLELTRAEVFQK